MPFDAVEKDTGATVLAHQARNGEADTGSLICPQCGSHDYELRAADSEHYEAHFYHPADACSYETATHRRMVAITLARLTREHDPSVVHGEGEAIRGWAPDARVETDEPFVVECQYRNEDKERMKDEVLDAYNSEGYGVYWLYEGDFGDASVDLEGAEYHSPMRRISEAREMHRWDPGTTGVRPGSSVRSGQAIGGSGHRTKVHLRVKLPALFWDRAEEECRTYHSKGASDHETEDDGEDEPPAKYYKTAALYERPCTVCGSVIEPGEEGMLRAGTYDPGRHIGVWVCTSCRDL